MPRIAACLLATALVSLACGVGSGGGRGTLAPPDAPHEDATAPRLRGETAAVAPAAALEPPAPPAIALEPGVYTGETSVALRADAGSEIYYTLDGSEPVPAAGGADSTRRYEGPIALEGFVRLRAVAVAPGAPPSETAAADYRVFARRIEIDEPIVLGGSDVREFEDAYVLLRGDVRLAGDARLVLRDSLLVHEKDFAFQYSLEARDRAVVVVERSGVGNQCNGSLNWAFFDDARLEATAVDPTFAECNTWNFMTDQALVTVDGWDTFSGTVCGASTVDVRRSRTLEIELCFGEGSRVDTELPTHIDSFVFDRANDPAAAYTLRLADVEIDGWGINVLPGSDVTIRRAGAVTIGIIAGLPWDGRTVEVRDLHSGHYDDHTWEIGDARLRLIDTDVYGWEPNVFHNNTLVIADSDYSGSAVNSGTAHYEIVNSRTEQLVAGERVTMTVRDSVIRGDVVANDDAEIVLIDSRVEGVPDGDGSVMLGNVIARDRGRIVLRNTTVAGDEIALDAGRIARE